MARPRPDSWSVVSATIAIRREADQTEGRRCYEMGDDRRDDERDDLAPAEAQGEPRRTADEPAV